MSGIEFTCGDYKNMCIPKNSVVYCDPPYFGCKRYRDCIDRQEFLDWIRDVAKENTVFVSEYDMPEAGEVVWEGEVKCNVSGPHLYTKKERLYRVCR
jgi:DNA adenine methylase